MKNTRSRISAVWSAGILALAIALLWSSAGHAHFLLNAKNRTILIESEQQGINLYLRIPAPLIYARELAGRTSPTERVDAPFVLSEETSGVFSHYLDRGAIAGSPDAFGRFVVSGYRLTLDGDSLSPTVTAVRIHSGRDAPAFTTPEQARLVFGSDGQPNGERLFVGEAVVDLWLTLPNLRSDGRLEIVNSLPRLQLPPDVTVDNHIIDFRGGGSRAVNVEGQLLTPVELSASVADAVLTFVIQGIKHIVAGPDHVLFVLCLTIGAASLLRLFWHVTGFTIGHSVTLIAGFLGMEPAGPWFIPVIEMAIAASIIYAGVTAVWQRERPWSLAVTSSIGLLHGFGFSFVLADVLGPNSPHLLLSLFSFNLGVEVGQLAIVALAFGALALIASWNQRAGTGLRWGIASVSVLIAGFWVIERTGYVADAVLIG